MRFWRRAVTRPIRRSRRRRRQDEAAGAGRRRGGGGQGGRGGAGRRPAERPAPPPGIDEIRISSNENPLGPGKTVLDAIVGEFPEAGRYPFNSTPNETKLVETIAALHKAKPENVVLGAGSQEILKTAIRAFTSPFRPLVTGAPTFENCTGLAAGSVTRCTKSRSTRSSASISRTCCRSSAAPAWCS